MTKDTLQELLVEQLRDMYDAEKQLVKALPKMAKNAESEELAEAFRSHLAETETQVSRLEEAFGIMGIPAKGKSCKAMKGLLEEGSEAMKEDDKGEMRDLAMIAAAQRVEHYEISAYGTARTLAEQLELDEVAELLQTTEDEEKQADEKLTECAVAIYDTAEDEEVEEEDQDQADMSAPARGRASAGGKTHTAR